MTPENFTYWMQGYVELVGEVPTKEQWKSIVEHLELVFTKVTATFTQESWDKLFPKEVDKGFFPDWYENHRTPTWVS